MARKKKEFYLHPYTISFDRDGVHMLGETSAGDCCHTIGRWKIPRLKKELGLDPKADLFVHMRAWPEEKAENLHQFFMDHSTEGVVYWDQDEFDRFFGTTWT